MKYLLIILLAPLLAFAGDEKGNGGNAVVCRQDGKIVSAQLLDYYEAQARDIELEFPNDNYQKILSDLLGRLERINPDRAQAYKERLGSFFENAKFHSGVVFVAIDDSQHVFLPKGCAVEQVAVQRKPVFPEDKLFNINKDIWDYLPESDRAGLILHEIIYEELLSENQKDSTRTRYFNAKIAAKSFKNITQPDYFTLANLVGISTMNWNGLLIQTPKQLAEDGTLAKAYLRRRQPYETTEFHGCVGERDSSEVIFAKERLYRGTLCVPQAELTLSGDGVTYRIKIEHEGQASSIFLDTKEENYVLGNGDIGYSGNRFIFSVVAEVNGSVVRSFKRISTGIILPISSTKIADAIKLNLSRDPDRQVIEFPDDACTLLTNPIYDQGGNLVGFDRCERGIVLERARKLGITPPLLKASGRSIFISTEDITLGLNGQKITFPKNQEFYFDGNTASGKPMNNVHVPLGNGAEIVLSAKEIIVWDGWNRGKISGTVAQETIAYLADGTEIKLIAGDSIAINAENRIQRIERKNGDISMKTAAGNFKAKSLSFSENQLESATLSDAATLQTTIEDRTCFLLGIGACVKSWVPDGDRTFNGGSEIYFRPENDLVKRY